MLGLGDNVYQRAVLRELACSCDLWLETSWPQIYRDLPIKCVRSATRLRTQAKNVDRFPQSLWHVAPADAPQRRVNYANRHGTMLQELCESAGIQVPRTLTFDLPAFEVTKRPEPYILIRPATIRAEWRADSRNPWPEYLAMAANKLRPHFRIISVADLVPNVEWPVPPMPYADECFHAGELGVEQLLALAANAAGIVGGVGWVVPVAMAYKVPLFLIFGGWGGPNGPQRIFDPRIDNSMVYQVVPDRFCLCTSNVHQCDKRITSIGEQIDRWIVQLLALRETPVAA